MIGKIPVPLVVTRSSWPAYLPAWVASAILIAILVAGHGVVTTIYTHDLYVAFDGAWRTFLGQRPYANFHSPVGFAYFLPHVLLRAIEPFSLSTLLHANAVVAVGLLILATLTLPRRLSPAAFFFAAMAIVTVVISPRAAGFSPDVFSHLAPYNRWSEGAMMLMAAIVLLAPRPPAAVGDDRPGHRPDFVSALALALLGLFLLHLKVTYFLCSLLLVVVGLVSRQFSWRTTLWAVGFFVLGSVLIELTLHLHRPYWDDLQMARHATLEISEEGIKVVNKKWGAYWMLGYLGAVIAVLLLHQGFKTSFKLMVRRWWRLLGVVIGGLLIGVLANTQTHMQFEVPLMSIVLLVAWEAMSRALPFSAVPVARQVLIVAIVLVFAGAGSAFESAAVVEHTLISRNGSTCPVPALVGTPGEQLLFLKHKLSDAPDAESRRCDQISVDTQTLTIPKAFDYVLFDSARVEVARLSEAETMLRAHSGRGPRVVAFDFANPFPAFNGTPPPDGALLWWDFGRTYSTSFHPDPAKLLDTADFVLESRWDPFWEPHGENMWSLYKPDVMRRFVMVEDGRLWRLWQRKPG